MAVMQTPFNEVNGRVSPDGHWIAYQSNESGKAEIYVQSFPPSGNKWKISNNGGNLPVWRRDGKEVFYGSGADGGITSVDVQAQKFPNQFTVGIPHLAVRAVGDDYDVTADGQRFLINTLPEQVGSAPITVVVNWMAGLQK